jgi:sugar/nucleoside kinase (ribokinase family)
MTAPRVVVVGHVTHDRYGGDLVPGGCAFYGAHTHRGLGATVRLLTVVGEDFACDATAFTGVDARVRRAGRTTLFTNIYPEGGIRIQKIEAQAPAVRAADLPADWATADVLHLAPVMGEVDLVEWTRASRARLVGIGVQGWIKEAGPASTVVQKRWAVDAAALRGVGAVAVGEEDLVDQGDLLDRLVAAVPIVAFTHGKRGCEVIVRGKTSRVGVFATSEVDPTGAGDTFAAGFFFGLARGDAPVDAARLGAAAASIVVEARGGESLARVGEAHARAARISPGDAA